MPEESPRYLSDEARLERRKTLEPIIVRVRARQLERRVNRESGTWTDEEHALVLPHADKIKRGESSYTKETMELRKVLPHRTIEAIRKKLKCRVLYEAWHYG